MNLLSVDPGKTGGMALFILEGDKLTLSQVLDTPYDNKKGLYDYCTIFDYLTDNDVKYAVLEHTLAVSSSGTSNAKQVGIGEGMWLCLFSILHIDYEYSHPANWTKQLGLRNDKSLTKAENKKTHIDLAANLYPEFESNFIGPRGGQKDGIADAVLIGEAWYRNYRKVNNNV